MSHTPQSQCAGVHSVDLKGIAHVKFSLLEISYCETQRFTDQKLSSSIFACCSFVRPSVRIGNISTYLHNMMF